ncbi:MAG: DUF1318 domain-containing protein [Candidatus Omnitrophota bacterium]
MKIRYRASSFLARFVVSLFLLMGCARVSVETKEPIKLDVTMRLDIYQHVAQDAQNIEDMISSPKTSWLSFGVPEAWAQEEAGYPSDVTEAIERRKDRRSELRAWQAKGVLGEGADGFVTVASDKALQEAVRLAEQENRDRRIIYQYVAQKNGVTVEETARIFAQRIQADAPTGTPTAGTI